MPQSPVHLTPTTGRGSRRTWPTASPSPPAALTSPSLARAATHAFLAAHHLADILDPALQAVGELTAAACRFTTDADIYVSLHYRGDALRVTVYDGHAPHANHHLAAVCGVRRRATL
ncbi:hypothetical protein ACFYWS_36090 [Streptomyces sp. NPDC002795]|uniref:hypothetical protein n=1 Tax=Streptomyces sp. NPDC002795 TaxID=3364665 RepID=UPI00367C52AA